MNWIYERTSFARYRNHSIAIAEFLNELQDKHGQIDVAHIHVELCSEGLEQLLEVVYRPKLNRVPAAIREQACLISTTGAGEDSFVNINCDNRDEADEIADWLVGLAEGKKP